MATPRILFLLLIVVLLTTTAQAAAPVGQTIWIRASATGLFIEMIIIYYSYLLKTDD